MARRKLLSVLVALVVLIVAWRLGAFQIFADPGHMKETLLGLGVMGCVVFVLAFGLVQPFGVPGTAFILGAALVWPPIEAAGLSLLGATLSSTTGFTFSRYVARDWVEKRIPKRFRKYDARLAERGFVTVFFLRLVFWMNPTMTAVLGLSSVRFTTHLAASVLGYIAPILILTYFGDAAFAALKSQPRERWIAAAAFLLFLGLVALLVRFYRRRRALTTTEVHLPESD